jgi:PhnB protein
MRISPHLIFDGQCRAAFDRYHRVLGGELSMLTFGESPMAPEVEPHWHDRIVHATLRVGDLELAGADVLPQDYATPQGFSVLLAVEDLAEAEKIFAELATDGEVKLAFQATFWSSGFGVLTDRFGIPWEVSYG